MIDTGHIEGVQDQVYYNSNIVQFRPAETVGANNFSGQVTFEIDIPKDEVYFPKTFYMGARVSVNVNNPASATPQYLLQSNFTAARVIGCIASGGINNVFSKASHELGSAQAGSSVVQTLENYPQVCGLLRQSHEHPLSAKKNKTDIINYIEDSKFFPNIGAADGGRLDNTNSYIEYNNSHSQSPFEYIISNAKKQGLDTQKTLSLTSRLPFAMFMQEAKLYQGKHILRFTIDSAWRQNLINAVTTVINANPQQYPQYQVFTGAYGEADANPGGANGYIGVTIQDLFIYGQFAKINKRPIGKHIMMFENFNATSHPCASASSDNFLLPIKPHLLKLIVGFRSSIGYSLTDTINPAVLNPVAHFGFNPIPISQLRIKYLSDTYPQQDYNMRLVDTVYTSAGQVINQAQVRISTNTTDNIDTARAYEDYYNAMEYEDSTKCMTFEEWRRNPVFVFNFCSTTNTSSNIEMYINTTIPNNATISTVNGNAGAAVAYQNASLSGVIVYMLYVYRSMVEVDYGEDQVSYKVFNLV